MKTPAYLFLLGLGAIASTILAQTPGTFTATGNMTTARVGHSATLLLDGRVLIVGGDAAGTAELYDPATRAFTPTGNLTTGHRGSATLLPDGRVLIAGSSELYDPFTGTFSASGTQGSLATLLTNGKVLITGVNAELYDPSTGTFTLTGPYAGGSFDASTSTLLADGRVLFAGALTAELYDPVGGIFSPTGFDMSAFPIDPEDPLVLRTATLLPTGKALLAGGEYYCCGGPAPIDELYDPSTGTFTATGNPVFARRGHTATLLPDGTVLVAGSQTSIDGYGTAETYDPATGAFTLSANMVHTRFLPTATLLLDGTVLIAGGSGGWPALDIGTSSAEIYTPPTSKPAPALLSLSGDGQGQGAIQHAGTTRIASASDPAVAGEYLSVYLTGLADGSMIPPQVAIGGRLAEITFFGNVPGYPGLNVINVRMPGGLASGPAVPVRLTYLGRSSNQVTIGVSSPVIVIGGVVNAASNLAGAIAPGELVVVTGSDLGPAQLVSAVPDSDGLYSSPLAGTTVLVNGTPAQLIYTSATQVAAVVPDSVSGDTARVTVTYNGQTAASFPVPVAPTAPGIFTRDATGQGHAAAINQNGSIDVPAHWEGDVMTLFLTGAGHVTPAVAIYTGHPLPITQGTVPGVMQIKVPIPHGTDCDLPVVFQVGNASSQAGVTIAVDLCI
jgi:uncharacterized protein (TIGR03437 family)